MGFRALVPALLALGWVQAAPAQTPAWRFRWQAGQVLTYRVEQQTQTVEVLAGTRAETKTKTNLVKRWQVLSVDAKGVATLQHSLAALRMETVTPSGETLLFDSANLDKSSPQLREQLSKYVGVSLSTMRVDAWGRVVEVKESKFGPASRFEAELPFVVILPGAPPGEGQSWQREYKITLEPPAGTGEQYASVQRYTYKRAESAGAVLAVRTEPKALPEALADQVPLLRLQPEGEVVFDLNAGRLHSARLRVQKELKGHQGEGSSYRFESTYTEDYAGN
jgi:hypothetical protein